MSMKLSLYTLKIPSEFVFITLGKRSFSKENFFCEIENNSFEEYNNHYLSILVLYLFFLEIRLFFHLLSCTSISLIILQV